MGESGSGVEAGESGCRSIIVCGVDDGEALAEGCAVEGPEASPMAKVALRNLSSKLPFGVLLSDKDDGLPVRPAGLPDRWEARDLRKEDSADSANCPEDNGAAERVGCESRERGRDALSRWSSVDEMSSPWGTCCASCSTA